MGLFYFHFDEKLFFITFNLISSVKRRFILLIEISLPRAVILNFLKLVVNIAFLLKFIFY
ncbi:hypothetical protein ykris0001_5960 [Yersinia kristensenii ATCC 33638]|nr:hypothetical protein ykris0001_5960 [Yersinia kristensenii ATCC 33638]